MDRKECIVFQKYHPIVIFLYLLGGIGVTMCVMHPVLMALSLGIMMLYGSLWLGRVFWLRLLWLGIPVAFFSLLLMPLFSHRGETALLYINDMAVTWEMFGYGLALFMLLLAVFAWFQIAAVFLNQEKILFLFGKILPKFGLLLTMVFRLVPLMGQRFREIHDAQKCFVADAESNSPAAKARQFTKELSILISWFLEESMERAISMESRGYGVCKRTSFTLFRWERKDGIVFGLLLLLYSVVLMQVFQGTFKVSFFPVIRIAGCSKEGIWGSVLFGIAILLPVFLEIFRSNSSYHIKRIK